MIDGMREMSEGLFLVRTPSDCAHLLNMYLWRGDCPADSCPTTPSRSISPYR